MEKSQQALNELLNSKNKNDIINSPAHYTQGTMEVIEILEDLLNEDEFRGFLRGNILKYNFRYRLKNGIEDLKKSEWYLNRLVQFEAKVKDSNIIKIKESNNNGY